MLLLLAGAVGLLSALDNGGQVENHRLRRQPAALVAHVQPPKLLKQNQYFVVVVVICVCIEAAHLISIKRGKRCLADGGGGGVRVN